MPLRDWVNVMKGKGYVTFLYLSANTPEKTERALRLYGEVTRSLARGIGPDTDTEHSEVDATAREKARLQQRPELWECIHGEWEEYEKSMKSIKRIRMPGAFSFYSCDPQHSAQDRAPEGCCKEYYASRNNPGMWKEAWLRLQEYGWKERLEAARQSLGAKMDACAAMRGGPPPGER